MRSGFSLALAAGGACSETTLSFSFFFSSIIFLALGANGIFVFFGNLYKFHRYYWWQINWFSHHKRQCKCWQKYNASVKKYEKTKPFVIKSNFCKVQILRQLWKILRQITLPITSNTLP